MDTSSFQNTTRAAQISSLRQKSALESSGIADLTDLAELAFTARWGTKKTVTIDPIFALGTSIVGDDQTILDQLQTIINEKTKLKLGTLEPSLNLESSGLDSLARINLVMEIEDHFDFELTDSEAASITTVADLVEQIKAKTTGS